MADPPSPGPVWSRSVDVTPHHLRRVRTSQALYVLTMPSTVIASVVLVAFFATVSFADVLLGRTVQAVVAPFFPVAVIASIVVPGLVSLRRTSASSPVGPQLGDTLTASYTREGLVLRWADQRRELPYWLMARVSGRAGLVRIRELESDRSIYLPSVLMTNDDAAEVRRRITWWRERPQLRPRPSRSG